MGKALVKASDQARISAKLLRYAKEQGRTDIGLKDIRKSLSGIGVSLSKRVIEGRETR
ncbi:MAG: hypothetical protein M0Z61_15105 [Nitrospiraceae bacterium]|nr:hypothetical protein [Nitrospiraceae bacterium]